MRRESVGFVEKLWLMTLCAGTERIRLVSQLKRVIIILSIKISDVYLTIRAENKNKTKGEKTGSEEAEITDGSNVAPLQF